MNATMTTPSNGTCTPNTARRELRPSVRILETTEAVELIAAVPGADENSTELQVENDTLTLVARVVQPAAADQVGKVIYSEFRDGDYRRTFRLTDEIDRSAIEARVKDGVLRVRLPKTPQAKTQKITVTAG